MDYSELFADPEDLHSQALIEALNRQQQRGEAARSGLQETLQRQQGQAGGLRTLSLLSSMGDNPLMRNLQQTAGQQGAQMESLAARTEQRLGQAEEGITPLRVLALKLAAQKEKRLAGDATTREERLQEELNFRKQRAGTASAKAAEKAAKDAEERIQKLEAQFRKEVLQSDSGKKYMEAKTAYKSIESFVQNPSAANDMALVFAAMKSLDPDSVVKEGEQVQVRNTTNIPGRMLNYFTRAQSGESFSQDQRAEIQEMARLGFSARANTLKELSDAYAPIVNSAGGRMGNVMPLDLETPAPPKRVRPDQALPTDPAGQPTLDAPSLPTPPAGKVRIRLPSGAVRVIPKEKLGEAIRDFKAVEVK